MQNGSRYSPPSSPVDAAAAPHAAVPRPRAVRSMATSERKRVVVTGACGYVASLMLPELREKYELV